MIRTSSALLIALFAATAGGAPAQNYGPFELGATANDITATADGGAIVGFDGIKRGYFRINPAGTVTMVKRITNDVISVDALPSGETLVLASAAATSARGTVTNMLLKVDARGETVWTRNFTFAAKYSRKTAVAATREGGALVIWSLENTAVAAQVSSSGDLMWSVALDLSGTEELQSIRATRDGGAIAAGGHERSPWIVKLTPTGAVQWQQRYSIDGLLSSVTETTDGDFTAVGRLFGGLKQGGQVLVRLDRSGKLRWQRNTAAGVGLEDSSIEAGRDGEALVAIHEAHSVVLYAVRPNGTTRWKKRLHLPAQLRTVQQRTRSIARSRDGWWLATHVSEPSFPIYTVDDAGRSDCAAFSDDVPDLTPADAGAEAVTVEVSKFEVTSTPATVPFSELSIAATPLMCTAPPAAVAATPAGFSFAGRVEEKAFEERVSTLWRERKYKELDALAEQLRRDRTVTDPMRWKLDFFYDSLRTRGESLAARIQGARDWQKASRDSITACIALANAVHAAAWEQRGSGFMDTVTASGIAGYETRMREARSTLASCGPKAEQDPEYWILLIKLSHEMGLDDVRDVAKRGAKLHRNPRLFRVAGHYLHSKWGGSPAAYMAFADEVAKLYGPGWGDALYMWLAYHSFRAVEDEEFEQEYRPRIDWARMRKGFDEAIRLDPNWVQTYHRYARAAGWFDDRETARSLFQRPELAWYEDADLVWGPRYEYDRKRNWALGVEAEPKVASGGVLKQAPANVPMVRRPLIEWPQLLLQGELVVGEQTYRRLISFLVQTPSGAVAIGTIPRKAFESQNDPIGFARAGLRKWTMWLPADPARVLTVSAFDDPPEPLRYAFASALTLAPVAGELPVPVLPMLPEGKKVEFQSRVFVVGCSWKEDRCEQTIIPTTMTGTAERSYNVGLPQRLDEAMFHGGVLIDENGYAIGVIVNIFNVPNREYTSITADWLSKYVR